MINAFGKWIREKRLNHGLSLREFCRQVEIDPSYWSKVERGKKTPQPDNFDLWRKILEVFDWKSSSDEAYQLVNLARLTIIEPSEPLEDADLCRLLPMFVCTMTGERPSRDRLLEIASLVREEA